MLHQAHLESKVAQYQRAVTPTLDSSNGTNNNANNSNGGLRGRILTYSSTNNNNPTNLVAQATGHRISGRGPGPTGGSGLSIGAPPSSGSFRLAANIGKNFVHVVQILIYNYIAYTYLYDLR